MCRRLTPGWTVSCPAVEAVHWRIRTGIAQSDTSLTTEVNLALALEQYDGVKALVLWLGYLAIRKYRRETASA